MASEEYIDDLQTSHNILMTDSLVQFSGSEKESRQESSEVSDAEQIAVPLDYNVLKGYELKVQCNA